MPRGLNLYSRLEYDKTQQFEYNFFDNEYMAENLTLSACGNETITLFNDYFMTSMTRQLNFATQLQKPYVMFLNGEYWGVYWLTEKYDEKYLEYYYNITPDNAVIIKNSVVEKGNAEDIRLYNTLVSFVRSNDMSLATNYNQLCEMIDIDSFTDYYATMIYIARVGDWPSGNFALWRTREYDDNTYSDCRWRWMLFDCNSPCMGTDNDFNYSHDTLHYVLENDVVFYQIWQNTEFRDKFMQRINYISDNIFASDKVSSFIDSYTQNMETPLSYSWKRFYGSDNDKYDDFVNRTESIRSFFENRSITLSYWNQLYDV